MKQLIYTFERIEKKYRITVSQKERLLALFTDRLTSDLHGENTICSLYLDTRDYLLIRNSIDAKVYKEKLRIRSYGAANFDSRVFFEIKKKFKGIVYKRRVAMSLEDAVLYIESGQKPLDSQIMSEIDYAMNLYRYPKPAMMIMYERQAFFGKQEQDLRITFDSKIRYRNTDLSPEYGFDGYEILPENELIMEIKTAGAMPLWLSYILDSEKIYPSSFSKYGTAYHLLLSNSNLSLCKGDFKNVSNF